MRRYLFILLMLWSKGITAQTLHLIMVSDVEDKQFGRISLGDETSLMYIAETTQSYLNYQLRTVYLNRRNFTAAAVRKVLDTLRTQPNDLIFWYYSGLGWYPKTNPSPYPSLKLKDSHTQVLSLDDAATLLGRKKVRLALAMADIRSKFPKEIQQVLPMIVTEDLRKLIVEKLFLSYCGVVKVASSQRGEHAYSTIGRGCSAFMSAFFRAFQRTLKITTLQTLPNVSLSQLFRDTQSNIEAELRYVLPPTRIQHLRWQLTPCQAIFQSMVVPIRSVEGLPTHQQLDSLLNSLTLKTTKDQRRRVLSALSAIFTKDAVIRLTQMRANAAPSSLSISIGEFLKRSTRHNPQIKAYRFEVNGTKRTEDFRYFRLLELTEVLH